MRQNQGKPDLALALQMPGALEAIATVLRYGEIKYGPATERSWLEYKDSETRSSLMRHVVKDALGHEFDEESGIQEIAHALFNLACLCDRYHSSHGPGSFWRMLHEDCDQNLNPLDSGVSCDLHPSHRPSVLSLEQPSDAGPHSS